MSLHKPIFVSFYFLTGMGQSDYNSESERPQQPYRGGRGGYRGGRGGWRRTERRESQERVEPINFNGARER